MRKLARQAALTCVAGLTGAGVALLVSGSSDSAPTEPVRLSKPFSQDPGELTEVSRAQRPSNDLDVEARLSALEARVGSTGDGTANDEVVSTDVEELTTPNPAEKTRSFEAVAGFIETTFDDQATDPEWAQRAEKAMFDSTASPAFRGAELEEAECRRTLCRAVVTFEDHHARERFPQVIDLEPWTHGGFVRDHEDGKIEVFVVREGHALPTPPPEQ